MNINKLDILSVDELVNNALYKNDLILPVLISTNIIKESTSGNKVYTILVLFK